MRPRLLTLVTVVLIASSAIAQNNIPNVMTAEVPVQELAPLYGDLFAVGTTAIAANDHAFGIITATDRFSSAFRYAITVVDENGIALQPASIEDSGVGDVPGIATDGDTWLAVSGGLGGTKGRLLDPTGRLLKTFTIHEDTRSRHTGHDTAGMRSVAWNGSEYVVISSLEADGMPGDPSPALIATRVSAWGEILQNDIVIAPFGAYAQIAARNGIAVIAWPRIDSFWPVREGHTEIAVMTGSGGLSSKIISAYGDAVSITAGDDGFLLAIGGYTGGDPNGIGAIALQHLSPSGALDAPLLPLDVAAVGRPSVTWTGSEYLVAWRTTAPDTVVVRTDGRTVSTPETIATNLGGILASNGRSTLLVWAASSGGNSGWHIEAKRLPSGEIHAVHHTFQARNQDRVLGAWDGGRPVAAWNDSIAGAFTARVGSSPQIVASPSTLGEICASPSSMIVLWVANGELFGRVAGGPDVRIDTAVVDAGFVRAVWTGSDFLAVWTRKTTPSTSTRIELRGARLSAQGQLLSEPVLIGDVDHSLAELAIGTTGSSALVVLKRGIWGDAVHGVLITPSSAESTDLLAGPESLATSISVASDGTRFFLSWVASPPSASAPYNDFVSGRFFDTSAHPVGEVQIFSPGGDRKPYQRTFWTGSEFLAVWEKKLVPQEKYELQAARITSDGRLLDYPPESLGTIDGVATSISRSGAGQLLVAYTRNTAAGLRAFTRIVTFARRAAHH